MSNPASIVLIGTILISLTTVRILAAGKAVLASRRANGLEMVLGLGIDLAEVERYKFDERKRDWFARKIYTPEEWAYAMRKRHWAERLAGFYAAKEAVRKAFGHAIPWRSVGVTHERSGKPGIVMLGRYAGLPAARGVARIHLTITHTGTMAAAVVVLEG